MVVASPLNLKRVTTSANDSQKKVTEARSSVKNVGQVILKRTKVKREAFAQTNLFRKRREENEKRMMLEDELEAPTVVRRPGGPQQLTQATGVRGFFDRILGFIGYLSAGWLLNNLPTWIAMGKEFVARIQKAGQILSGFFNNTVRLFVNVGNVLGALGQNLLQFDFFDTSNRVKVAMGDLNFRMENLTSQIEEAYGLLTTPLTEGKYSGEKIPETGTQQTNEGAYAEPPPYSGPAPSGGGFSGSGVSKGAQIAKRLQKDLGLTDYQAAAVVGNLLNESSQLNPAQIQNGGSGLLKVDGKTGYGWAQWTDPGRQRKLYALAQKMGIDPSKQPLTDEVNYAMLVSELPTYDSGGRFRRSKNIQEASNWLLAQYFRPADQGPGEQRERIEASQQILKSTKSSPSISQPQRTPTPTQSSTQTAPAVTTAVIDQFKGKPGGAAGIITSERGMRLSPTTGKYRMHQGIDIAPAGRGYFVALKLSGKVNLVAFDSGGYGNYVDIKSENTIYRFAHLAKVYVKQGQTYNGATIGEIGSTGGSTGIHLHFEVRPNGNPVNPKPYLSLLSIGRQLTGIAGRPSTVAPLPPTPPTPAQIAAAPQQLQTVPSALTPERRGQDIFIIGQPRQQQNIITPASGGGDMSPSPISDFQLLNNFIKNKLLLDLAYV
jgi:murein DD-endopeptidase MepM/ murein hydrolase activator NlpD